MSHPVPPPPVPAEPTPLAGRRVLVARAAHQQGRLSARLRAVGAEPVEVPLLAIDPPGADGGALGRAVRALAAGDIGVVGLTSPNGVAALVERVAATPGAEAALAQAWVGCVGPGTARRFRELAGRDPDLVAPVHTTAGLGEAFPPPGDPGRERVLLPRGDLASGGLPAMLAAAGWRVDDVEAYRTRLVTDLPEGIVEDLVAGRIDAVAAASPSTVEALVAVLDGRPLGAALVSIGPVTSARARGHGRVVAAEADPHDLDGLVLALAGVLGRPAPRDAT